MFKHWMLIFALQTAVFAGFSQTAKIRFHLSPPSAEKFLVVGYYQGGKAFRLDTLRPGRDGEAIWTKAGLSPGVFFCHGANGKLFEFILPTDSSAADIGFDARRPDSLWSANSEENEAFFRFEQKRKNLETRIEGKKSMRQLIAQATKNDTAALKPVQQELNELIDQTDRLALDFVAQYPQHLFAKMLRSVRVPDAPAQLKPRLKNGNPNPAWLRRQRLHYWDNSDFQNEALLNNAFWQLYFDNFFARYVSVQPDSIIRAVDEVLAKMPRNGAFYQFVALRITQYYEQNEAPGADRIFVHMVDKYQRKGQTPWLDDATLERLAYKADAHRPNLCGSMAVNFVLPDEKGGSVELYNIEAPATVLIFYSPLCSHCMEIMPNLYQLYLDYLPKNVAVVAINTDKQTAYWKKFIGQQNWTWYDADSGSQTEFIEKQYTAYNLPVIYLLDKEKRILAKRIKPNELGAVLGRYLSNN